MRTPRYMCMGCAAMQLTKCYTELRGLRDPDWQCFLSGDKRPHVPRNWRHRHARYRPGEGSTPGSLVRARKSTQCARRATQGEEACPMWNMLRSEHGKRSMPPRRQTRPSPEQKAPLGRLPRGRPTSSDVGRRHRGNNGGSRNVLRIDRINQTNPSWPEVGKHPC